MLQREALLADPTHIARMPEPDSDPLIDECIFTIAREKEKHRHDARLKKLTAIVAAAPLYFVSGAKDGVAVSKKGTSIRVSGGGTLPAPPNFLLFVAHCRRAVGASNAARACILERKRRALPARKPNFKLF